MGHSLCAPPIVLHTAIGFRKVHVKSKTGDQKWLIFQYVVKLAGTSLWICVTFLSDTSNSKGQDLTFCRLHLRPSPLKINTIFKKDPFAANKTSYQCLKDAESNGNGFGSFRHF